MVKVFLGKLGPKHQNCQFQMKFGPDFNSNMQNPMGVFTFSVWNGNHPFWANLVWKIEILSLSRNLVPSVSTNFNRENSILVFTFSVSTWKTLLGLIWSKNSILLVWREISCLDQFEYAELLARVQISCFRLGTLVGQILTKKVQITSFIRSFIQRLVRIWRIQWWFSVFSF